MRAIIQRVSSASVSIGGTQTANIEQGLLILLGIHTTDTMAEMQVLADKCTGLRIFTDENDKMNLSCEAVGGSLLVVSQFTLYGNCKKGKRPSFIEAARPETAIPLYEAFVARCRQSGLAVQTGEFGADMQVELVNDGPVTLVLDTNELM